MYRLTLGSLFDGSGGFALAGALYGIEPLWASEIEPFPIRVTTKRLPAMHHLGDITKMDGAAIPPVDIITGGFPCQNLSMAGKRDGLHGERSGLFFQMVRVIREMREATKNKYPRFVVVENVPGMYSSSQGRDFREVLNELVKIKDKTLSIPMPQKKWLSAGEIVGDDFSLAWRTLCASMWGVPQRRRRCFLVLDFDGKRAGEIQFNESRLSGNPPQVISQRQRTASDTSDSIGSSSDKRTVVGFEPGAVSRLGYNGHAWEDKASTIRADMGDNQLAVAVESHPNDSRIKLNENGTVQTLTKRIGIGGGNVPLVLKEENAQAHLFGICSQGSNSMKSDNPNSGIYEMEISRTLDTGACSGNGGQVVVCMEGNAMRPSHRGNGINKNVCFTLNTVERHTVMVEKDPAYAMIPGSFTRVFQEQSPTLCARDLKDPPLVGQSRYIVRRLTPQECAMLQGFPFDWCAGLETPDPTEEDIIFWTEVFETHRKAVGKSKKPKSRNQIIKWLKNPHTDGAEYRLWGNGVALPCVSFVLGGIAHEAMKNTS